MKEDQVTINNLLGQRTSRAVDRIFSQNNPEQINTIFNALQNRIRNSSNELRQTLYRKYQNLINCSQLLDSLYLYAKDLNEMNNSMRRIVSQKPILLEQKIDDNSNIIAKIQREIQKNSYLTAMQKCIEGKKEAMRHQIYYMEYLEVQIVQKMQEYLLSTRIDKKMIEMAMKTLKKFLEDNHQQKIKSIAQGQKKTLLSILFSNLNQHQSPLSEKQLETLIFSTLFEHKLTNLAHCENDQEIQTFFNSLLQLCRESTECEQLARIFKQNYSLLESNLILIFIENDQNGLKFQYQLYNKLTTSINFRQTLTNLERILYPQGSEYNIISIFQKLWQNYYKQLIEYIIDKVSPLNYIEQISQANPNQQLPLELNIYSTSNNKRQFQSTYSIRKNYQNKILPLIINNMNSLCEKGNLEQIVQQYTHRISELNEKIKHYKEEDGVNTSLRKIILIHLLCESYNRQCIFQQKLLWSQAYLQPPQQLFSYASLFHNSNSSFEENMIALDTFFIGYSTPYLTIADLPIIQGIIIKLLTQLKQIYQQDLKSQQRIAYSIQRFKKQPQPISIHKGILTGIGRYIFQLKYSQQQLKLDQHLYQPYLSQVNKRNEVIEHIDDAFDIGEKESGDDMVSIGMKTVGNIGNIFSGFMKRK